MTYTYTYTNMIKILFKIPSYIKNYNYSSYANTIYALSSGYGKCGVAVIRVSGPHSGAALTQLTNFTSLPRPRTAYLRKIYNQSRELLDKGLILWFPGEDCCEFQVHGGPAVVSAVLNALGNVPNFRPAEPGEFTRRAFLSGKLDLTEVEGLSDLLQAETEIQRKQAVLQTEGALKKVYSTWRSILLKSVANIEAHIDFEESELLEKNLLNESKTQIKVLINDIEKHLLDGRKGEVLRNGIKAVIIGEPNVGKSSLLNVLCQRPVAIVTALEGTTRDLLETTLDISGYPVILLDTAGLRKKTSDIVEQEGIKRARSSIHSANLIILVADACKFLKWTEGSENKIKPFLNHYLESLDLNLDYFSYDSKILRTHTIVLNKSDLLREHEYGIVNSILQKTENYHLISCENGKGLDYFLKNITEHLKYLCGDPTEEHPNMNKERHRHLLQSCLNYLILFENSLEEENKDIVIKAQYLRSAIRQLGKLTGNIVTDDFLDIIFKNFCIGK